MLRKRGVELQSEPEDEVITREGDPRDEGDAKEVAVDQEVKDGEKENEEHEETQDNLDGKNEASNNSSREPDDEKDTASLNGEVSDKAKNIGVRALGSLVNGGLAFMALGARSPVGLLLKRFDEMKEAEEAQCDDESEGGAETKTDDANDL